MYSLHMQAGFAYTTAWAGMVGGGVHDTVICKSIERKQDMIRRVHTLRLSCIYFSRNTRQGYPLRPLTRQTHVGHRPLTPCFLCDN